MKQFVLTPAAGKRLIARALAVYPAIQSALRSFDKAIKLEPGVAVYWHEKGRLLKRMGRQKEAEEAIAEGIRLDQQGEDSGCPYWPLRPEA
jgi:tetratricopeptide (TPR) repeat protein